MRKPKKQTETIDDKIEIDPTINRTIRKPTVVEITDQDKEKFFKAFLLDQPYEEEVSLFGGKKTLKFRALTSQQLSDIFRQLTKDYDEGYIDNGFGRDNQLEVYRLSQAVVEEDGEPIDLPEKEDDADINYITKAADRYKSFASFKLIAYLDAFSKFLLKCEELGKKVFDKDFWKAVE